MLTAPIVRRLRAVLAVIVVLTVAAACGGEPSAAPLNMKIEPFAFADQDGRPVSSDDLNGKVWIAHFIFTSCTTVCPTLTANMARLQKKIKESGVAVDIVTFSVDPEVDTPQALKTYLSKFGADFASWHGLTGYTFEEIRSFSRQSFRSAVEKNGSSGQVVHSTSFFLVDRSGTIVAKYDGERPPYDRIVRDAAALAP